MLLSSLSDAGSPIDRTRYHDAGVAVVVLSESGFLLVSRQSQQSAGNASPRDTKAQLDDERDGNNSKGSSTLAVDGEDAEGERQLESRSDVDAACAGAKIAACPGDVPETIQVKYKLPPMDLTAPADEPNTPSKALTTQRCSENLKPPKVSRAEYEQVKQCGRRIGCFLFCSLRCRAPTLWCICVNQRIVNLAQRVSGLATTLKTMRTSFQIFSADVMEHMNALSRELEDRVEHGVAHT